MKINTNGLSNKKKSALLAGVCVVITLGLVAHLELSRTTDFLKNPLAQRSTEELQKQQTEQATRNDPTTDGKNRISTANEGVDPNKTTDQVPSSSTAYINITQLEQKNGQITYAAQISGLESDGTCSATFTKEASRPVVRSSIATGNTCAPVNIPETEFSQIGTWKLSLRYFANNQQTETTKDIDIQ